MKRTLPLLATVLALALPLAATAQNPRVTLDTTEGKIVLELDAAKAPKTVANFLQYAKDGFYNGTVFHRVIAGFMIQGGGFTADIKEKDGRAPIQNEAANGLPNDRGTIAMARTSDPHSASSQFFINLKANSFLNKAQAQDRWGYTVFGKVVEGMDVVDKIAQAKTTTKNGMGDVPVNAITIKSATVSKAPAAKKK